MASHSEPLALQVGTLALYPMVSVGGHRQPHSQNNQHGSGTLSDTETIKAPKITVSFERSVKIRDFESAKASIYVEVPTRPGDTWLAEEGQRSELDAAILDAMFHAKVQVFEALGLGFDVTPDGRAIELLEDRLGAVEITRAQETAAVAAASSPTTSAKTAGTVPTDKEALWAELCERPDRWFDNREGKKNPNAPDFKRAGHGDQPGLWLSFRGTNNVPDGLTIPPASAFKNGR